MKGEVEDHQSPLGVQWAVWCSAWSLGSRPEVAQLGKHLLFRMEHLTSVHSIFLETTFLAVQKFSSEGFTPLFTQLLVQLFPGQTGFIS